MNSKQVNRRQRLYEIVEIGAAADPVSRGYDFISTFILLLNLAISLMLTFEEIQNSAGVLLGRLEAVTVAFFAADYVLRLITARCKRPDLKEGRALAAYIFSFSGLIDLFSFLPWYLPFFFPAGTAAFRLFRVIRVFRLFRLNAYYDSLNVITEVIYRRKKQLMSSVFIILTLMIASSLCMYSLEHDAQPEVFKNAFSGIWWSVATILTVGYGDIYPITPLGKFFSILITFLGVGIVAIPTGIISAGFVEQYTRLQQYGDVIRQRELSFLKIRIRKGDSWAGIRIRDLKMPKDMIIAVILRGKETVIPVGDLELMADDVVLFAAEPTGDERPVHLKEILLAQGHPWIGRVIEDLDISRQTYIVMIRRQNTMLVPRGDTVLKEKDTLILYTKTHITSDYEFDI